MIEPGIYPDLSNADYHADKALGSSGLKTFCTRAPLHFTLPTETTHPMDVGTALHTATCEPDRFTDDVLILPQGPKAKASKAMKEEIRPLGKVAITQDEFDNTLRMVENMLRKPEVARYISNSICESSMFWKHPIHDFMCKCRPDGIWNKEPVIWDIKSIEDASPGAAGRAIANFKYHWSATWYSDGTEIATGTEYRFIWIFSEKKAPFDCAVYEDENAIFAARAQYSPYLERYAECLRKDYWPGYPGTAKKPDVPPYALKTPFDS